MRAYPKTTNLK